MDQGSDKYDCVGRYLYLKGSLSPQHVARLAEIDLKWAGPGVDEVLADLRAKGVSLRQVDWLISKYGVSNPVVRWGDGGACVSLGEVYYGMLRVWRRRGFDCFARHSKVYYQGADGHMKQTSVGQLNFWLVMQRDFDILQVLGRADLMREVRKDMAAWERRPRSKKRKRSRRKAPPLGQSVDLKKKKGLPEPTKVHLGLI